MSGLGKSPLAGLAALGLGGLAPANTGGLNPAGICTAPISCHLIHLLVSFSSTGRQSVAHIKLTEPAELEPADPRDDRAQRVDRLHNR